MKKRLFLVLVLSACQLAFSQVRIPEPIRPPVPPVPFPVQPLPPPPLLPPPPPPPPPQLWDPPPLIRSGGPPPDEFKESHGHGHLHHCDDKQCYQYCDVQESGKWPDTRRLTIAVGECRRYCMKDC